MLPTCICSRVCGHSTGADGGTHRAWQGTVQIVVGAINLEAMLVCIVAMSVDNSHE